MPIEIIPEQREGLRIGLLAANGCQARVLRRLQPKVSLAAKDTLTAVPNPDEARSQFDLVFELHRSHWRLVEPANAPSQAGIWHHPDDGLPVVASAIAAARWLSAMLHREIGTALEFADVSTWLRAGGELQWRRISSDPVCVDDIVLDKAEWLVGPLSHHQLLDLSLPLRRGARRQFMALQEALQALLPNPAGTWVLHPWGEMDPNAWPSARGLYMVLHNRPCPSESAFRECPDWEDGE
ncbi:MAG: hypothetical protein J0L58_20690 [Burkholderiales bacterium]|nr:hypothetical protein [Burkholderiales bacterium]